ncbi:MAG: hypothetical protein D6688_13615 [Alphaproteobacteria bacterium]|nr:MAG: hypothetical protein D6688_13615 [Alphaproteobacteria bacterium]
MQLVQETAYAATELPVADLSAYLRLSSGFPDDGSEDARLQALLAAAVETIEARLSLVLLERRFRWRTERWSNPASVVLPVAPVRQVDSVTMTDADGASNAVDPALWRLVPDDRTPRLQARGACLPPIPPGGMAEVSFPAGFGPTWPDVPVDLRQAVVMLAADWYDRPAGGSGVPIASDILRLLQPYRRLRIGGAA